MSIQIDRNTRRNVLDWLMIERIHWAGQLDDTEFLSRLYDLATLPSHDSRFPDAGGDIWQHRVNNPDDWPDNWVFDDERFNLLNCEDSEFLAFLAEMLARPDSDEAHRIADALNRLLAESGFQIVEVQDLGGHPIFAGQSGLIAGRLSGQRPRYRLASFLNWQANLRS